MLFRSEPEKEQKKAQSVTDLPGVGAATAEKLEQVGFTDLRSEERRVGKECRSRWWPEH